MMNAGWAGNTLIDDMDRGVMDRYLASPVRRVAIINGILVYQAAVTVVQSLIVFGVAFLMGARYDGGVLGVLVVLAAAVLLAVVFAALSCAAALLLRTGEALIGIFQFLAFLGQGATGIKERVPIRLLARSTTLARENIEEYGPGAALALVLRGVERLGRGNASPGDARRHRRREVLDRQVGVEHVAQERAAAADVDVGEPAVGQGVEVVGMDGEPLLQCQRGSRRSRLRFADGLFDFTARDRNRDGYATVGLGGVIENAVTTTTAVAVGAPVYITSAYELTPSATGNTLFGYALTAKGTTAGEVIEILLAQV